MSKADASTSANMEQSTAPVSKSLTRYTTSPRVSRGVSTSTSRRSGKVTGAARREGPATLWCCRIKRKGARKPRIRCRTTSSQRGSGIGIVLAADSVTQGAVFGEVLFVNLTALRDFSAQAFQGFSFERRGNRGLGNRRQVQTLGSRLGDEIAIERQVDRASRGRRSIRLPAQMSVHAHRNSTFHAHVYACATAEWRERLAPAGMSVRRRPCRHPSSLYKISR
jgi:hypothetical protein